MEGERIMTLQEQLEVTQKAIDNNELDKLFLGKPGYKWGNLKHIPANVATDIGAIIEYGLYVLYQNGNKDIPERLKATILSFLDGTPVEIWTAYFILRYQYRNEIKNQSPFNLVTPQLCKAVSICVQQQKDRLVACKEYVGYDLPNGLWEDIQRLENVMISNYGVSIL